MTEILFISHHIDPFLDLGGSFQRTNLLLRACAEVGNVDLVAFCQGVVSNIPNCRVIHSDYEVLSHKKQGRMHKFFQLCRPWSPYATFQKNEYKVNVTRHILENKEYDFIVTRYIPKAMECGLLDYAAKLVIDVDDLPYDAFRSASCQARTLRNRIWLKLMSLNARYNTRKILGKVFFSFSPNPLQVNKHRSSYLPNIPFNQEISCDGIDFKKTTKRIFFIGDLDYFPNYAGVDYFIEHVYSSIVNLFSDVEFHIGGRITNPDLKTKWELFKGVKVLGFVEDLTREYTEARVVVVPIYHGGGTNIKVLEALQMKRACVVTEFATRGFNNIFEDNKDYKVAFNDSDFIGSVVELLTDQEKNRLLAENGFLKIRRYFTYSVFSDVVRQVLYSLSE